MPQNKNHPLKPEVMQSQGQRGNITDLPINPQTGAPMFKYSQGNTTNSSWVTINIGS